MTRRQNRRTDLVPQSLRLARQSPIVAAARLWKTGEPLVRPILSPLVSLALADGDCTGLR
jgi:hypothetical protein